ncbi:MAG: hypothetical protein KAI73_07055, partial [Rhodospirillaceae bacterium]|nr:hypothetical protein [Rhodospirillaceae bacterium]
GIDLNFPGLSEKQLLEKIDKFAERSHYFFQRIYVSGITSPTLGKAAIEKGYNYISGTSVGRCRHIRH